MKDTKYIRKRKRKYGFAFLIDIPYKDDNGNQKHFAETVRVIDFPTEKAALSSAQKIRNDALADINSGKLRQSVPSVRNIYRQRWNVLPLSVKTRERHDHVFRTALEPYADIPLSEITLEQIQRSLNDYADRYQAYAVSRVLTVWKSLYKTAAILGYDIQDMTLGAILPPSKVIKPKRNVNITDADFQAACDALLLYNATTDIHHNNLAVWYMLQIMYFTGCRPAEALALTRSDINCKESYIRINKSVGSTRNQKGQIIPTKTPGSVRNVPIVPALLPILESLLSWSHDEQLFLTTSGNLFEITYVSNLIRLACRKEGIHFTAYMLRHKMSTDLLHAGDAVVARDLLGHTSFGMTLDYARSTPDQLRAAIENRAAESQPKNKNHQKPPVTILKTYQIFKFTACLRTIACIKAISQNS